MDDVEVSTDGGATWNHLYQSGGMSSLAGTERYLYASGMVCAVSGAVILLNHLWRLLKGELSDDELIGIRESEEEPIDVPKPLA